MEELNKINILFSEIYSTYCEELDQTVLSIFINKSR
jgi:hypothetical protein